MVYIPVFFRSEKMVFVQEKTNQFVVDVDGIHDFLTVYARYCAMPNVVVCNIHDLPLPVLCHHRTDLWAGALYRPLGAFTHRCSFHYLLIQILQISFAISICLAFAVSFSLPLRPFLPNTRCFFSCLIISLIN